jgi:hypothetical protein
MLDPSQNYQDHTQRFTKMAQWNKLFQRMLGNNEDIYEVQMLADKDGNIINSFGSSANIPIADGTVEGYSVRNIFGTTGGAANIVTTEFRTPWEEASNYTFPSSASTLSLVSSAIGDTTAVVLIQGLDENFLSVSETKTLTGTTPITTSNSYLRVNDMIIISGNATGNVTLGDGVNNYAVILAGNGRCQKAVYTVPAGYCFFLTRIDAFCTDANGGKAARFRNFLVSNNASARELRVADTTFFENMNIVRQAPFKYDEKTDIEMQLRSLSGSTFGSVFAEGILVQQ